MKSFLSLLFLLPLFAAAQEQTEAAAEAPKSYRFRVTLADKKHSPYKVKQPEAFLSKKAIERRKKFGLKVDEHDLPVSPYYLEQLRGRGYRIYCVSKWNNTAVVEVADSARAESLKALPFVTDVLHVWTSKAAKGGAEKDRHALVTNKRDTLASYYGHAERQVQMIAADKLHKAGFKGEGVTIAVIDGGFHNTDLITGLSGCRILGTRNFVNSEKSVYEEHNHGMMVLACIGANHPQSLVGTAPDASFYLLVSEDTPTEQLVEEDNWCAAVEYADSLGADIVTSSLGYYKFDHEAMSHKYNEQNGRTAINSRSASLAASRGILVLNSAGNEGDGRWKKIGFPADATDILTVGAVDKNGRNALFSSLGNTADGRIKPDVMAQGVASAVYESTGEVVKVNGTSFSTPILCGGVACLVQAFPNKKPTEIIRAVQFAGDNVAHPDNVFGYGIPDLWKAYEILKKK